MQTANVGDVVHVVVDPRQNNGSDVAPAMVTRVWNDELVNVRVLLDGPDVLWLTSVKLFDERPAEDDETVGRDTNGVQRAAFRPPRS